MIDRMLIEFVFPSAVFPQDYAMHDEKLVTWNEAKLGKQPTLEFLESKRAEAEAFFAAQEKAKLIRASQLEIANNHIADLSKMVIELREKLAIATGVKFDPVPAELAAKLVAVDSLKAG